MFEKSWNLCPSLRDVPRWGRASTSSGQTVLYSTLTVKILFYVSLLNPVLSFEGSFCSPFRERERRWKAAGHQSLLKSSYVFQETVIKSLLLTLDSECQNYSHFFSTPQKTSLIFQIKSALWLSYKPSGSQIFMLKFTEPCPFFNKNILV